VPGQALVQAELAAAVEGFAALAPEFQLAAAVALVPLSFWLYRPVMK
jgi:hypothetical protein